MAANIGNTIDKSPLYAGVAAALKTSKTIVWGGARVKLDAVNADHVVFNMGDASISGFANGVLLFRDDDLSGTLDVWRLYVTDATNSLAVNTAAASAATTGTWQRIVWAIEILSTTSARVSIWLDNGTVIQNTGTYNNSGGLTLGGNDLRIGARNQSAGDYRAMNGSIEDCFVCHGALPSAGELTALQTESIRKVAATSSTGWTLHFHADLATTNMRDRVSGTVPTVTTTPTMKIDTALDYGRSASACVLGDPQKNNSTTWPQLRDGVLAAQDALNLGFVATVGDNTHFALAAEYALAKNAYDAWLAAGLPVFSIPGNHDFDDVVNVRNTSSMEAYLPPSYFTGQAEFVAQYQGTRWDTDSYTYAVEWNGWLWVFLPWAATPEEWSWCRRIMHQHPDKPAALVAHAFLNSTGDVYGSGGLGDTYKPSAYDGTWHNPNDYLADLKQCHNLRLIFAGHDIVNYATQKSATLATTNAAGDDLLLAFANNQEATNATDSQPGGDGLLWLLEFDGSTVRGQAWFARTNELWTGSNSQFELDVAPTHLLAHYKLDETSGTTAADSSGNGHNGTYVATPMLGQASADDALGTAVRFNGASQYISLGSRAAPEALTLSLWVKFAATASNQRIVHLGRTLLAVESNGTAVTWWSDTGVASSTIAINALGTSTYKCITLTQTGTTASLYIDGVLQKTVTTTNAINTLANASYLGCYSASVQFLNGWLDDVRIYDVALSPAEIAELVALGPPTNYDVGLVGRWQCDETSGTTLTDSSGNGRNGTLVNNASGLTAPGLAPQTGTALHYNGSNDKATVADHASLRLLDWTCAGFVNFDSLPTSSHWTALIGKGNNTETSGLNHNYAVGYDNGALGAGGAWFAGYEDSAGANNFLRLAATPALGQTYFLCATYDSVLDLIILYVNGVEVARQTATATPDTGASTLSIGWADSATGVYLDGLIDEVRLNGRALLAVEVYELYTALQVSDATLLPILMQLAG